MSRHPQEIQLGEVEGYRFRLGDLDCQNRKNGISGFMRIRNGEEYLELTIRSHLPFFDEIVAVYNDCSDETGNILKRLQKEFGEDRLRVIEYCDPVYPPGSVGHRETDSRSPNSLVNYYNFALAATRYTITTKLDDDHLAIPGSLKEVTDRLRDGQDSDLMHCFAGVNLVQESDESLAIVQRDPISGGGDIGFFVVSPDTYFSHDRRFERFQRGRLRRVFSGYLYWHLKSLKHDFGFGNYQLDKNPDSRYAKRWKLIDESAIPTMDFDECSERVRIGKLRRILGWCSEKQSLLNRRDRSLRKAFPIANVETSVRSSVDPEMFQTLIASLQIDKKEIADRRAVA